MGEEAERNRQVLQGRAIQGCVMLCVASTEVVIVYLLPRPRPQHLGGNLVSLQEKKGGGPAPPKATFRLQSDCLWPRGMADNRGNISLGGSLSYYLQTSVGGSQKTRDVSNTTPKAARMGFFSSKPKLTQDEVPAVTAILIGEEDKALPNESAMSLGSQSLGEASWARWGAAPPR